jgi:hypothetical protein
MVREIEPTLASTRRLNPRRGDEPYLAVIASTETRSLF